ncbi:MAG: hypothetical protein ABW020_10190 [Candidatus Rokuibacteriota bacterium]
MYGVANAPPLGLTLLSGFQHVVLLAIRLLFPVLVAREAGLPPSRVLGSRGGGRQPGPDGGSRVSDAAAYSKIALTSSQPVLTL